MKLIDKYIVNLNRWNLWKTKYLLYLLEKKTIFTFFRKAERKSRKERMT